MKFLKICEGKRRSKKSDLILESLCFLRSPAGEVGFKLLYCHCQYQRDSHKYRYSYEYHIHFVVCCGRGNHEAKAFAGAKKFTYDYAEDGPTDREAESGDNISAGVGQDHYLHCLPLVCSEGSHHVDQNSIDILHALVGIDEQREYGADEDDHNLRPHPDPEPEDEKG